MSLSPKAQAELDAKNAEVEAAALPQSAQDELAARNAEVEQPKSNYVDVHDLTGGYQGTDEKELQRLMLMAPNQPLDERFSKGLAMAGGGTYNLGARILAARDAIVDTAKSDTSKEGLIAHLKRKYDEQQPLYQRLQKKAEAQNPGMTLGGALMAPGPKSPSTIGGRLAQATGIGAGMGAAGAEEGDVLKDAALGGGVGLLAGGTSELIGSKVIPWLKGKAERMAWKAMQGSPTINDIAATLGYENEADMKALGRYALDQGVIPVIGKADKVADNAGKLIQQGGVSADAQYASAEMEKDRMPFDFLKMMGDADAATGGAARTAAADDKMGPANQFLDQIARQDAKTPGSYIGARELLTDAQDAINLDTEAPLAAQLQRKALMGARGSINEQIGTTSGPSAQAAMEKANEQMSKGYDIQQLANRAARRDMGHSLNIGQLLVGMSTGAGAGAMTHGGAGAAGFGALGALPAAVNYATKAYQPAAFARLSDFAVGPAGQLAVSAPAIGRGVLSSESPVSTGQAGQDAMSKLKAYFGGDVPPEEAPKADFVKAQTDSDYRKQR